MKKVILLFAGFMLTTALSARMNIPRHVYELDRLDEAMAKASQGGKALSFVLTDPGSTCGLCIRASEEAFNRLRSHSEIVLLRSKGQQYSQQ